MENPGYSRTGKAQMRKGGVSDPRNKTLMKIFNLINIGERAGSGVPNIFNVWEDEGWIEPVIEEKFSSYSISSAKGLFYIMNLLWYIYYKLLFKE